MQVKELESKGLKKSFKITVDAAQINEQFEKELKAAGERVKIPGFRPGFIPLKILQQRYGKSVQADVLKQVINQSTNDVIIHKQLRPALTPQINIDGYEEGGELTYTMSMESFPEVPEVDFSKITLDRNTFDIEESEIDEALDRLAERSPKLNKLKSGTKAANGNVVNIDFKGMINGVAFDGGTAEDFRLELGSKQFIEGFEDQLIGTKEGDDVIVKVTFPKDYPAENLAGKEASFAVKVKEVAAKEKAVIDDEFAKARGLADVRALREAIRNQLIREYDQVVRNQLKKELFDKLEDAYDFELPEGMVEIEFNTIWERLKQAKERGDPSVADIDEDEKKKEYQQIAQRRVKLGLLLAEIGTKHKIQISREELQRAVMQQAQMWPGQEKKVMDFYRSNPDRIDDLRGPILEEKAVDFILAKAKFNDQKITVAELLAAENEEDEAPKKKAKSKSASKKKAASE